MHITNVIYLSLLIILHIIAIKVKKSRFIVNRKVRKFNKNKNSLWQMCDIFSRVDGWCKCLNMSDLPTVTVLPWDSRFWLRSHDLSVGHETLMTNWHLRQFSSLILVEYLFWFQVFENKNNPSWSLIKSPMQIGKLRINVWLALASLHCIGCLFHSLIFKGFFNMHLKEEFAFPISLWNQRNLLKKAWPATDTKTRSEDIPPSKKH